MDFWIPLFDDYAMGFSGCDNFNQVMHRKTWPYRYLSDKQSVNDYLFTWVSINFYNIWQYADNDYDDVSFSEFRKMLAVEMVKAMDA